VINAVDAIAPDQGTVTVAVRPSDNVTRVIVEVRDTGIGIPSTDIDKIFVAFYTTKGERGTGLGLPVVREIVESYSGKLVVSSEVGKGSTFRFDLPR
jgi:signal transduction histidine kinase